MYAKNLLLNCFAMALTVHKQILVYNIILYIDALPPVISAPSPTATSVTITWTQPEFSLPVVGYTVTVTRLNGLAETVRCASYTESRLPVTTTSTVMSVQFIDLQEFSSYTVTIIAIFSATFEITPASSNLEFTTLSAGMIKHIHIHMYACR